MSSVDLTPFATNRGGSDYPANKLLIFGSDYGHSGFVTPMARFQFFNAFGESTAKQSPIVFIRMGGTFQTGLSNRYTETTSIFGSPQSGPEANIGSNLANLAKGGLDAVYKQLAGAGAGAAGFIGSAGLSGKAQYEFLTRRVLNSFQQLIYNGPVFRNFQLPFTMKPTSLAEAERMIDIIKTFQIASSPKGDGGVESIQAKTSGSVNNQALPKDQQTQDAAPTVLSDAEIREITGVDRDAIGGGSNSGNFSFGYPDMCQFQILLKKTDTGEGTDTKIQMGEIFHSGYCVIENVQVDYGGQNKMVFFSAPTGGKYYPSEVTLTIGLRETTLPTADFMSTNHTSTERTIF
jgi:hypothetical protein